MEELGNNANLTSMLWGLFCFVIFAFVVVILAKDGFNARNDKPEDSPMDEEEETNF